MNLVLLGLNHRTAPVAVRERYALGEDGIRTANEKIAAEPDLREGVTISTCNRTEIVAVARGIEKGERVLHRLFGEVIGDGSADPAHFYAHSGAEAVAHVFRVAASMDSMVLGEAQILGQMKRAYALALASGSCGPVLNRLFHRAFRAAKRVRAETGLGATSISLARVGVQLAREIFEDLAGKRLALVGAGEIAEAALRAFCDSGLRHVVVLNRTVEAAARIAGPFRAQAAPLEQLEEELTGADVVMTSVSVERPLVSSELVARSMRTRGQRPLLMIDLGMPRNVEPDVKQIEDAYLYDVDDLDQVAQRGLESRRAALIPAQAILALELEHFERWQAGLRAVPTIRTLIERTQDLARSEARRTLERLPDATPEARAAIERMADSIVAKLLHRPMEQLRSEAADQGTGYYADAIREIFGLEEEDD